MKLNYGDIIYGQNKFKTHAEVIYGQEKVTEFPNECAKSNDVPASVSDVQNLHCHVNSEQVMTDENQATIPFQFVTREMWLSQAYSNLLQFTRSCEEHILYSRAISCTESMDISSELTNKFACDLSIPANQKKFHMQISNTSDPVTLEYETIKSPRCGSNAQRSLV